MNGWLAPQAVRASLQRRGVEVGPTRREKMKNFMALKDKIVKTDELIERYQAKAKECEQYKGRLASQEQATAGLRAELQALHEENGMLKVSLQSTQRQLLKLEGKTDADEVVKKQLMAQVEQLRMKLRSERITESRREKNEEKDRLLRQYQSLWRQFEAYKQAHARAALRPARHRRTSDTSTSSSLATVSSPGYIPVFQSSPMSIFSLPDTMEGRSPPEDLLCGELYPSKNNGEGDHTLVSASPEDPPPAEQQNENLPAPSSCSQCDPIVHQDASTSTVNLSMAANDPSTTDSGEDSSDDALSVSDSSSVCSESSLDDLADYLNSSQETTDAKTSILPLLPTVPEVHDTQNLDTSTRSPVVLARGSFEVGLQSTEKLDTSTHSPEVLARGSSEVCLQNSENTQKLDTSTHSPVVLAHGSSEVGLQNNQVPCEAEGVLFECVLDGAMKCKASPLEEQSPASPQEERSPPTAAETSTAVSPQIEPVPEQKPSSTCHVATDSNTSEENDLEDISFLEIDGFLSPLPFSPHRNLQTISPLPPTPMPKDGQHISTPFLSPIILQEPMISPLPQTPSRDQDGTQPLPQTPSRDKDSTQLLPQTPSRDKDSTQQLPAHPNLLPQFADSAPMGLHIPKPCVALGSSHSHHKLACKQLRLSESSLFSPPFDSTHQPTLGLTSKCLSLSSSGVAFEATSLELHSQLREKVKHSQANVDKERTVEQLPSDSMVMIREETITPTQETSAIGGTCAAQEEEANVPVPPSGVDNEFSGSRPVVGSTTLVNPVVGSTTLVNPVVITSAVALGLSVGDSDTEEGEIVDSEGEDEVFDSSNGEGEIVGDREEEEGEIVGDRVEEEGEIVGDREEEEGEVVDGGEEEGEEVVDNKGEKGAIVNEGEEEEMFDGGEKEAVNIRGEKETFDSGGKEEGEVVDRRKKEEIVGNTEEEKDERVGNREEEGEIVGIVREEEREAVDSLRDEGSDDSREQNTSKGGAVEGSQGARRRSARLRQGRTENTLSQLMAPANHLWTGRKQCRGPPPSLPQTSRQRNGVGGRKASCEKVNPPLRKKQRMVEPLSCQSPPTLEATPENLLPGYQLRSRCVNIWQTLPKRRRRSASESKDDSPPVRKTMKMTPPGDEHVPSNSSENNPNPIVRARRNSEKVPVDIGSAAAVVRTTRNSEKLPVDNGVASAVVRTSEKSALDNGPALRTRRESEKPSFDIGSAVRTKGNSQKLQLDNPATTCERSEKSSVKLPMDAVAPATSLKITRDSEKLSLGNGPAAASVRTRRDSKKLQLDDHPAKRSENSSVKLPIDAAECATSLKITRDSEMLTLDSDAAATTVRTRRDSEKLGNGPEELPFDNGTAIGVKRNSKQLQLDDHPAPTCKRAKKDSVQLPMDTVAAATSVRTRRDSDKLTLGSDVPTATNVRTRRGSEKICVDSRPAATAVRTRRDSEKLPVDLSPADSSVRNRRDSVMLLVDDGSAATSAGTGIDSPVDGGILVTPLSQASKKETEGRESASSVQRPDDISLGTTPWVGVVGGDVGVGGGKHVRQTDGATGQEEDRTPASSPRNKEVGQRSSGSKQPTVSQQIIGALQLPFNTSTPLTSQQTFHLPPQSQPPGVPLRPPPATSTSTSLVQQQLTVCMQCPLPLPLWLVNAMSKVQSCGSHNPAPGSGLKNKKRGNPRDPIFRQKKQMPFHYAVVNLERLMCGHLFLSTAITMFSDTWSTPSPADLIAATIEYLTQCYNPHFEQVVTLFHQLCDNVRANPQQLDPLDPAFPPALLRQECQFVALFAHICRTNKNMTHLLPELTKALHQAILAQGMKFHRLAALCRLFTAMCRLQGEPERVLFLCLDLVKKPLGPNEYPVLPGIGSIWPRALSRRVGVKLVERNQVLPHGLEQQPLTYTLEFIVVSMFKRHGEKTHESLLRNMYTLCKWSQISQPSLVTSLVRALVEVLKASQKVYIDSPPPGQIPWRRPRPSTLAFHVVHCLRSLTWHQGWVWTNDVLIRAYLWPLLQQWNSSADSVREATIVCTMRLIGFIGQLGVAQDPQSSSIAQLQRVLIALLQQSTSKKEVSLPIQLAAADSLLELCPPSHPRAQEAMTAINTWLGTQCRQPAGMVLAQEFNTRLQPYLHVRAL